MGKTNTGALPDRFERAAKDGAGCLAFLLGSRVVDAAETIGDGTIGTAIRCAGFGHPMQRPLRAMGVVVRPAPASVFVAVAAAHPVLSCLFDDSDWCDGWAGALMRLPGAHGGERMSFGRVYAPAVLVPRTLICGEPQ